MIGNLKNTLKSFESLGNFVLMLIFTGLFGLSVITVLNLTPTYETVASEESVLGVVTRVDSNPLELTIFPEKNNLVKEVEVVTKTEDTYKLRVKLAEHQAGSITESLFKIKNTSASNQKFQIQVQVDNVTGKVPNTSLVISDKLYPIQNIENEKVTSFKLIPGSTLNVDLDSNSEEAVNYYSAFEIIITPAE